jgi:hypothetical protein
MFTKATMGLAVILVFASGALSVAHAERHPWVPSGLTAPTGNLPGDELYNSCQSSHPVFSCPGA